MGPIGMMSRCGCLESTTSWTGEGDGRSELGCCDDGTNWSREVVAFFWFDVSGHLAELGMDQAPVFRLVRFGCC